MSVERRKFERFLFSPEERVQAEFRAEADAGDDFSAEILNISEGGLGINFINESAGKHIKQGDVLVIQKIDGQQAIEFLIGTQTQIRWILGYHPSRGTRSGCQFVQASSETRTRIKQFIQDQLAQKMDQD